MPPKGKASKDNKSDSKALITRGDRGVGKRGKRDVGKKGKAEVNSRGGRDVGQARPSTVKRDQFGRRPTTTKALILRNGKQGAMGTGEVVPFAGKISGREKLELLAEDLMTPEGQKSLAQPLDFEKCIRLADSQYNERLDDIAQLREPDFVFDVYKSQVEARTLKEMRRGRAVDPLEDKDNVALIVGTVIHNSYMFASGWQVIRDKLSELDEGGTEVVKEKLANNEAYREKYLVLLEFVDAVVDATYANMQVLLTTTPHYKKYFKHKIEKDSDSDIAFNWIYARDAYRSFLDSIVIELALPSSRAPKRVLFMILHEAVDEAPREARRFPQQVWDAFGDLSDILELQEMLLSPLKAIDGEKWRNETRQPSEDLLRWQDAQLFSERAALQTQNWKNIIYPLEKISRKDVLNDMWKRVNDNYIKTCMADLETLWGLKGALDRRPKWTPPPKKPREPEPHRITANGEPEEEDDLPSNPSMPDLQTISGSSESDAEEEDTYSDDEDDNSDDGESDADDGDEEDFDSDDEDDLRRLEKDAMEIAAIIPGIYDGPPGAELEGFPEDKRDNPFAKLLMHLRGRLFSAKHKVKTTNKEEPRGGFAPSAPPAPAATPRNKPIVQAETTKGTVRVEEVEDEDDVASSAAKKKKKKPKKKKKAAAPGDPLDAVAEEGDDGEADDAPAEAAAPEPTPESQQAEGSPKKSANKKKKKPAAKPAAASAAGVGAGGFGDSTTSFQTSMASVTTTAQSAHSYIKETGAGTEKTKTKSRPDHPTIFNNLEKDKKPASALTIPSLPKPRTLFGKMKRKTKGLMKRLIGTQDEEDKGDMRWEHFVKAMTDMGFSYDPSTAGSSVRFDPPDPKDPSITFHKPHPNSSLPPHMIKIFRKRLCDTYGWEPADFYS